MPVPLHSPSLELRGAGSGFVYRLEIVQPAAEDGTTVVVRGW